MKKKLSILLLSLMSAGLVHAELLVKYTFPRGLGVATDHTAISASEFSFSGTRVNEISPWSGNEKGQANYEGTLEVEGLGTNYYSFTITVELEAGQVLNIERVSFDNRLFGDPVDRSTYLYSDLTGTAKISDALSDVWKNRENVEWDNTDVDTSRAESLQGLTNGVSVTFYLSASHSAIRGRKDAFDNVQVHGTIVDIVQPCATLGLLMSAGDGNGFFNSIINVELNYDVATHVDTSGLSNENFATPLPAPNYFNKKMIGSASHNKICQKQRTEVFYSS